MLQTGDLFGYWKILETGSKKYHYRCLCTGCNVTIREIRKWSLTKGKTKSCGCRLINLMKETNKERYGCEFSQQNPEVKTKKKQTNIDKYGTENYSKLKNVSKKLKNQI